MQPRLGRSPAPAQPTLGDIVVTTQFVSQSSQLATPTPSPSGHPAMQIGTASGALGQQVSFAVMLHTGSAQVAGAQNDIAFDGINIRIAAKANGHPDCTVNADINKGATSFAFRPNGCTGTACTSIRALVLATDNVDPIADGSVLYTCTANVAAGAADGQYPLSISGVILEDPSGNQIPGSTGISGMIVVNNAFTPTFTPTRAPTMTPTPTRTADSAGVVERWERNWRSWAADDLQCDTQDGNGPSRRYPERPQLR